MYGQPERPPEHEEYLIKESQERLLLCITLTVDTREVQSYLYGKKCLPLVLRSRERIQILQQTEKPFRGGRCTPPDIHPSAQTSGCEYRCMSVPIRFCMENYILVNVNGHIIFSTHNNLAYTHFCTRVDTCAYMYFGGFRDKQGSREQLSKYVSGLSIVFSFLHSRADGSIHTFTAATSKSASVMCVLSASPYA